MANMNVSKVTRTALGDVRLLEVHLGKVKGKEVVKPLGTQILKVKLPEAFQVVGGKTAPVEQYAFRVDGKTVARFADAASLVLKKHHVHLSDEALGASQTYIQKAASIARGDEPLRYADEAFAAV